MARRRYSAQDRLAVRDRHPIETAVGKRVKLTKRGDRYLGLCPFHNEKTPSFQVNSAEGVFHCFGCGAHGDVVDWEMRIQQVSFPEAMSRLMSAGGLEDTAAVAEAAERRRQWQAEREAEAAAWRAAEQCRAREIWAATIDDQDLLRAYFASRGLSLPVYPFARVLRVHPALKYWVQDRAVEGGWRLIGYFPAIIALIRDCASGQPIGVHITYLGEDGAKLDHVDPVTGEVLDARKIRGRMAGGAIMLRRPTGAYLGIAEGWETALSVLQACRGFPSEHRFYSLPVWASVSLGNLGGGAIGKGNVHPDPDRAALGQHLPSVRPDPKKPGVMPPAGVTHPILLEDGDSADLASALADGTRAINRWRAAGCQPLRFRAPTGADFNDLIMGSER